MMALHREEIINRLDHLRNEYNSLAQRLDPPVTGQTNVVSSVNQLDEQNRNLKEENDSCKKDTNFLKDVVTRLNRQLNRYLSRDGPVSMEDDEINPPPNDNALNRQCLRKINALLLSYDEVIHEQNATIQSMKHSSEKSLTRMKTLQIENEKALDYIQVLQSKPEGADVSLNLNIIKEENDLMQKEIHFLSTEVEQLQKDSEKKGTQFECLLRGAEEKELILNKELQNKKDELEKLVNYTESIKRKLQHSIGEKDHKASIDKCSRLLEKLKKVYNSEACNMKKQFSDMKIIKSTLARKLSDSSEKVQGMSKDVVGYKTYYRKSRAEMMYQNGVIKSLKKSRAILENKLKLLSRVTSVLIRERKSLLVSSNDYKREALKKSQLNGKLVLKIKEDNLRWSQRFAESEGKRQATEDAWSRAHESSTRLRILLQNKDNDLKKCMENLLTKR